MSDPSTEYQSTAPETKSSEEVKLESVRKQKGKMTGTRGKRIKHGGYFGQRGYKKHLDEAGDV